MDNTDNSTLHVACDIEPGLLYEFIVETPRQTVTTVVR